MQTTRALLATSLAHPAGVDALPQVKSKKGRNFTYYSRTHIVTTHLLTYDYSPPQSVRVLHRVRCRNAATPPMVELVHVDSIITAMRSTQAGIPPKLTIASRCAYHQPAQRATGSFSAFPSGYIPRR